MTHQEPVLWDLYVLAGRETEDLLPSETGAIDIASRNATDTVVGEVSVLCLGVSETVSPLKADDNF